MLSSFRGSHCRTAWKGAFSNCRLARDGTKNEAGRNRSREKRRGEKEQQDKERIKKKEREKRKCNAGITENRGMLEHSSSERDATRCSKPGYCVYFLFDACAIVVAVERRCAMGTKENWLLNAIKADAFSRDVENRRNSEDVLFHHWKRKRLRGAFYLGTSCPTTPLKFKTTIERSCTIKSISFT